MEPFKITRPGQPYRVLPDDSHQLMTEAPHFCPRCITGFNCEHEPGMAAFESTRKSCLVASAMANPTSGERTPSAASRVMLPLRHGDLLRALGILTCSICGSFLPAGSEAVWSGKQRWCEECFEKDDPNGDADTLPKFKDLLDRPSPVCDTGEIGPGQSADW